MWRSAVGRVRLVGWLEGVSFVLLVGVAMPLKYAAGMSAATKVPGWIHGGLFMLLIILALQAKEEADWPWTRAAMVVLAALLPLGPFLIDRRLRDGEREREQALR